MNFQAFAYLLIICSLTVKVPGQQSASAEDYSCVTSVKFYLRKELLMDFFIKLALNETTCPVHNCLTTIADVSEAAGLSKNTSNVLAKATESLGLNGTRFYNAVFNCNMTVNSTLYYLDLFETSFSEMYGSFITSLANPKDLIPKVLNIINVSSPDFMTAIAYGSDRVRLEILSTGNYTLYNARAVLNVTNKNMTEMISFIPLNNVFKNLRKVNSTKLLQFVNEMGITSSSLINYFNRLNVSKTEFLQNPNFVNVAANINKSLNYEEVLGVFLKRTTVATVKKAKSLQAYWNNASSFISNYTHLYVETIRNSSQQYQIKRVVMNADQHSQKIALLETTLPFTGKLFNVSSTGNATRLFNCTYVSKSVNGGLYIQNVSDAHLDKYSFSAIKSNSTVYNLGSPLFCKNNLYGLAIEDYEKYINFTSFKSNTTITQIIPSPNENITTTAKPKPNSSSQLASGIISSVVIVALSVLYW